MPDADFSTRLFNAILQFEVDNGFVPLGILGNAQMDRLLAVGGKYLNFLGFQSIRHPMTNVQIWVPLGLPMMQETIPTGFKFVNTLTVPC